MPAVLTSLDIDDTQPDSFDFGTIVIYTVSYRVVYSLRGCSSLYSAAETAFGPYHQTRNGDSLPLQVHGNPTTDGQEKQLSAR